MKLTDAQRLLCKDGNPIVRNNLMTQPNYTPYCGNVKCKHGLPRTQFVVDSGQFQCTCGWLSSFPKEFISEYKKVWSI